MERMIIISVLLCAGFAATNAKPGSNSSVHYSDLLNVSNKALNLLESHLVLHHEHPRDPVSQYLLLVGVLTNAAERAYKEENLEKAYDEALESDLPLIWQDLKPTVKKVKEYVDAVRGRLERIKNLVDLLCPLVSDADLCDDLLNYILDQSIFLTLDKNVLLANYDVSVGYLDREDDFLAAAEVQAVVDLLIVDNVELKKQVQKVTNLIVTLHRVA